MSIQKNARLQNNSCLTLKQNTTLVFQTVGSVFNLIYSISMIKRFHFIIITALLVSVFGFSQNDSIKKADSISNKVLKEYKLQQISNSKELKLDSIKKSQLEEELLSLKTTDNLKKQNLLQQLEDLKNEETNRLALKRKQIELLKGSAKGYPVIGTFSDTLFLLYNRLGSFSAQDRAEAVTNRLRVLEGDYNFEPKSLKIINSETNTDIISGEKIIFSVSENDAIWNDTTPELLAEEYRSRIVANFEKHKEATSLPVLLKEIGLALLVILLFSALIYFAGKFFNWTASKIESNEKQAIKEIKLKDYTLLDARRQLNALLMVNLSLIHI